MFPSRIYCSNRNEYIIQKELSIPNDKSFRQNLAGLTKNDPRIFTEQGKYRSKDLKFDKWWSSIFPIKDYGESE